MKKIIALVLAVCCVCSLASCKLFKKDDGEKVSAVDTEAVAAVQAKLDAAAPETANITVELDSEIDTLKGSYFVTYNLEDGSATVVYTYEKFNEIGTDGFKQTVGPNTVSVTADGILSEEINGTGAVEALTFDINLDPDKLISASYNAGILTAKVKASFTKAVIGVAIASDVEVMIATTELGIASITISYDTSAGPVEIVATYTYYVAPEEEEGTENGEEAAE